MWKPKFKPRSGKYSYGVLNSCVLYAKLRTGYNKSVGFARNWPINSSFPTIGSVVVLNGTIGHVAIIETIKDETFVVSQTNSPAGTFSFTELRKDDPRIKGYYVP